MGDKKIDYRRMARDFFHGEYDGDDDQFESALLNERQFRRGKGSKKMEVCSVCNRPGKRLVKRRSQRGTYDLYHRECLDD